MPSYGSERRRLSMNSIPGARDKFKSASGINVPMGLVTVLAIAAWVSARADVGAVKVPVGSTLVNGEVLKPFENSWRMQVTKKDGTKNPDAGLWKDRFEFIDIDGKGYGVRIQDAIFKTS